MLCPYRVLTAGLEPASPLKSHRLSNGDVYLVPSRQQKGWEQNRTARGVLHPASNRRSSQTTFPSEVVVAPGVQPDLWFFRPALLAVELCDHGAQGETRTRTVFRPPASEAGVLYQFHHLGKERVGAESNCSPKGRTFTACLGPSPWSQPEERMRKAGFEPANRRF